MKLLFRLVLVSCFVTGAIFILQPFNEAAGQDPTNTPRPITSTPTIVPTPTIYWYTLSDAQNVPGVEIDLSRSSNTSDYQDINQPQITPSHIVGDLIDNIAANFFSFVDKLFRGLSE